VKLTANSMILRGEHFEDYSAIRKVNCLAFGQESEANLIEALRNYPGFNPELSVVAEVNGLILGHILFSQLSVIPEHQRVASLAPMAVLPERQRQGIGSKLVEEGVKRLRMIKFDAVFVLGHIEYYPRFGFSLDAAKNVVCPYSGDHFMGLELRGGILSSARSQLVYPPPFECV
jgi:putative acetyltransferase